MIDPHILSNTEVTFLVIFNSFHLDSEIQLKFKTKAN